MPNVGPLELIIVLVIVLLILGPKRLPGLGRQIGGGMREFKDSITSNSKDDDDDESDAFGRPALTKTAEPPATPPAPARTPVADEAKPPAPTRTPRS